MTGSRRRFIGALGAGLVLPRLAAAEAPAGQAAPAPTRLSTRSFRSTADLEAMQRRGLIRVLIPYSRTLFFQDRGRVYGVTAEQAGTFEAWYNRTFRTGARPLTVSMIPTSRERLIPALLAGEGDIAAGNITVTEERRAQVAFADSPLRDIREIVVTPAGTAPLADAEALSGREIAAPPGTSYRDSLRVLNAALTAAGKPPARVLDVPATLEPEDLMDMVAAKLLPAIVVDDWLAKLWLPMIPGLAMHPGAVLRDGATIAWAVRPDNPKLLELLNRAAASIGAPAISSGFAAYQRRVKQLRTATAPAEMERFRATLALFRRYSERFGFDGLMMLAQGFQESRLDQNARSGVGAIGLMQLMPATGQQMRVGDIRQAEANVHAGTKYMRHLLDTYFPRAEFDEQNRTLFAFAAYNAGPGRMRQMREQARKEGLDPNQWFDNVERVTAARVGQEPVRYVRNIYKYYIAYSLIEQAEAEDRAARSRPAG